MNKIIGLYFTKYNELNILQFQKLCDLLPRRYSIPHFMAFMLVTQANVNLSIVALDGQVVNSNNTEILKRHILLLLLRESLFISTTRREHSVCPSSLKEPGRRFRLSRR